MYECKTHTHACARAHTYLYIPQYVKICIENAFTRIYTFIFSLPALSVSLSVCLSVSLSLSLYIYIYIYIYGHWMQSRRPTMEDKERLRERVLELGAMGVAWWWWISIYWKSYIYIGRCAKYIETFLLAYARTHTYFFTSNTDLRLLIHTHIHSDICACKCVCVYKCVRIYIYIYIYIYIH